MRKGATTSLQAVDRPKTTAGTPHARAKKKSSTLPVILPFVYITVNIGIRGHIKALQSQNTAVGYFPGSKTPGKKRLNVKKKEVRTVLRTNYFITKCLGVTFHIPDNKPRFESLQLGNMLALDAKLSHQ